ncbi:hypothetical protein PRNP1_009999 [Phytophthora ramorum]
MYVTRLLFRLSTPEILSLPSSSFQNLPARGKMVKLVCVIVGVAGSAFPVEIDADQTVGDLKDTIKEKKPNDLKDIDADKLQLFLAKTEGGAWLSSRSEDSEEAEEGRENGSHRSASGGGPRATGRGFAEGRAGRKPPAHPTVETNPRAGGGSGARTRTNWIVACHWIR